MSIFLPSIFLHISLITPVLSHDQFDLDNEKFQTILKVEIRDDGLGFAEDLIEKFLSKMLKNLKRVRDKILPYKLGTKLFARNITVEHLGEPKVSVSIIKTMEEKYVLHAVIEVKEFLACLNWKWGAVWMKGRLCVMPKYEPTPIPISVITDLHPEITQNGTLRLKLENCKLNGKVKINFTANVQFIADFKKKSVEQDLLEKLEPIICRKAEEKLNEAIAKKKLLEVNYGYFANYRFLSIHVDRTVTVEVAANLGYFDEEEDAIIIDPI